MNPFHEADLPDAEGPRPRFDQLKHHVCILCTPVILVILACTQLYNARFRFLTPWEGGGFGMFSTVDSLGNRLLRCTLITDRGDFPVEVPPAMYHLLRKSTSIPSPELLSEFARQLSQVAWEPRMSGNSKKSNGAHASEPEYTMTAKGEYYGYTSYHLPLETGDTANVLGVRVEVMRMVFDAEEHRLRAEKILAVTENQPEQSR